MSANERPDYGYDVKQKGCEICTILAVLEEVSRKVDDGRIPVRLAECFLGLLSFAVDRSLPDWPDLCRKDEPMELFWLLEVLGSLGIELADRRGGGIEVEYDTNLTLH
jgi:hypothetical protein